MLNKSLLF